MIFVSGVHGVGKSYFCNHVKAELGIETYTASKLISAEKREAFSVNKLSKDIEDNQHYLLSAIQKLNSAGNKYILDGHFCLLNSEGKITRINQDTFITLQPKAIIVLTENPEVIAKRRKKRDGINCNVDEISRFQNEEIAYAKIIAKFLSVELRVSNGAGDLNSIIDFIRNL